MKDVLWSCRLDNNSVLITMNDVFRRVCCLLILTSAALEWPISSELSVHNMKLSLNKQSESLASQPEGNGHISSALCGVKNKTTQKAVRVAHDLTMLLLLLLLFLIIFLFRQCSCRSLSWLKHVRSAQNVLTCTVTLCDSQATIVKLARRVHWAYYVPLR